MTITLKSPARRFTRLTTILVITALLAVAILTAVWFAAPSLLARKAARRVTLANDALLVDGLPFSAQTDLFSASTTSSHITQRQLRMAFRGAAGTLQNQLGKPPVLLFTVDDMNQRRLIALWQFPTAFILLIASSDRNADGLSLLALPGINPIIAGESPATMDDLRKIYSH